MATLVLSAAGTALGAGFGGSVLGLSGAVIGRAIGATIGQAIDQRVLGQGSRAVEGPRVERFRLNGAGEGQGVPRVWGRARVSGQVIWATEFVETANVRRTGGGKGAPRRPSVTETTYSYSVSLALALCEGEIAGIGRIWADGQEIAVRSLSLRVYAGTEDQLPDPRIEAVEGAGRAPAYRGIAYVVIEDLDLSPFGNRVPQLSFEVMRRAVPGRPDAPEDMADVLRAVALIPGTGEYALATQPIHYVFGPGQARAANVHSPEGAADLVVSMQQLDREAPQVGAVSVVVSWFGDDLRAGQFQVKPKVEDAAFDGDRMPWQAGGIARSQADQVVRLEGRPVYGGTPSDGSVVEALQAIRESGRQALFYPFVLMEQLAGNGRTDPWTGAADQPPLPWRGRITTERAPGRAGTTDRTAAAEAEVAAFFGAAAPGDFAEVNGRIVYSGPQDWGYRRFILHYAHLCRSAGGVDAFCIGSELRGVTQIRGAGDSFPAVAELVRLAEDVRAILGPLVKIGYAADWTEYFGYHAGGNVYFHLDPLWGHPDVDFVGIDNYMPLSDWRETEAQADAGWEAIHQIGYLQGNVAGGEGYDWYYDSEEGRAAQLRLPITDGAHGEPWVFRYKDILGWWSNPHHDRIDGLRAAQPTAWTPQSKPVWFTEYGCAAVDKGTNEPNKFLDPKSSESALPRYSNGQRDDYIQQQYYRAFARHWADPAKNPVSPLYGGPMVDMSHAYAWAWDARPFPAFPVDRATWSDGVNHARGHWLNGRVTSQAVASVVAELAGRAGVADAGIEALHGVVRGFHLADPGTARAALQPLCLVQGADAVEAEGRLAFRQRRERPTLIVTEADLVAPDAGEGPAERTRSSQAEVAGRLRLGFLEDEGSYQTRFAEAVLPDEAAATAAQSEVPVVLAPYEARALAERWLIEARVARETVTLALPPSAVRVGAGDVIALDGVRYRCDRVELGEAIRVDATRIEPAAYAPSPEIDLPAAAAPYQPPLPVFPLILDLPLLTGDEDPVAPHVAVTSVPWTGPVAVWTAPRLDGFALAGVLAAPSVVGVTETALPRAPAGLWHEGQTLRLRVVSGTLEGVDLSSVLAGANAAAIGGGGVTGWEVVQFRDAVLVAPGTWEVRGLLRGQAGTDGDVPAEWPAGSFFVRLDGRVGQVALSRALRGIARTYRFVSARRGIDDPTAVDRVAAVSGAGLRPWPVAHLRAAVQPGGLRVTWVRRTRVDGDAWDAPDVPLGEERELYRVEAFRTGGPVVTADPTVAEVLLDPVALNLSPADEVTIRVAQVSGVYGPGAVRELRVVWQP
jgi:hypothetical protein